MIYQSGYHENLDELTGKYYDPQEFIDYKANVEKPLPMIYQSGYLTIKDYDRDFGTFLLDFPNNEVKKGFVALIASDYLKPRQEMGSWVRNVVISFRLFQAPTGKCKQLDTRPYRCAGRR